jgi:hypothetical protein
MLLVEFMRIWRIGMKKSHKALIEKILSEKHFDQKDCKSTIVETYL